MDITKLAWLTDTHLNFLKTVDKQQFYQTLEKADADAVLITGDIAEAPSVCETLTELSQAINKPIYFVLGNHDYYFGSVDVVRKNIISLCEKNKKLVWLGKPEVVHLNKDTILIGQDGWADGRYGDFDQSTIKINDNRLIAELLQAKLASKSALRNEMQRLADIDALTLQLVIYNSIKLHPKKIIIATHIPPFPEASLHEDHISSNDWFPYFASKTMGDVIANAAKKYSDVNFLVLCGHTHIAKTIQLSNNLQIRTGSAEYTDLRIEDTLLI